MTALVRPYQAEDCAACWAVFHRAVQIGARNHYTEAQRNAWSPSMPRPTRSRCARLMQAMTLVACDPVDNTVIGFMSLLGDGHLDMAFVEPDRMGRGVAGMLHDGILARARENGLTRLTTDASHLARPFLMRRGWRVIAPETIGRKGIELERFRMDLQIGDRQ
ncbi:GNAT family N-acetyltransferase [Sedimentitalea sp. JM2-8]|uniref:GNAT family N-acetyltransferase n=1 Tax=Sedimentitalea xiamensis TaxID=3050037 RepID=A0ABT7FB45_9RHOB|nr:GNAT family N-acetyltransferase [Sedimentitalea xiamensis]MDK3072341.1 GNAT family N-acetyltransferase [Sedimentitalea xiamensis]